MKRSTTTGAGELTEELTILTPTPVAVSVASLTRVTTTATVTTASPHGYSTGDFVTIAGAVETAYNGEFQIVVTGASTFTYQVAGNPTTPATGTITALFTSDSQGGQGSGFHTLATVWGNMRPLSASELLQAQAVNSTQTYEGKIYYRNLQDITPKMRISWTPYGYATPKLLEIHGVLPDKNEPRRFLILDVGEVL
ncbi:MAG TPA: phage head closure protein [Vicinamibacterales bacterium]|nr:phage head closure protein [Vicinamibacterales bacterium]